MRMDTGHDDAADADDPEIVNRDGAGPVVLVCEHASNRIPPKYGNLGLGPDALESHVAWDPGARGVAMGLSRRLDAPLIAARVSRLVYDLNRPADAPGAVPSVSEVWRIPGNEGVDAAERGARARRYHDPFHAAVADLLDARMRRGPPVALVTVHSFTPVYHGVARAVQVGILHDEDARLADRLLRAMDGDTHLVIRRNDPYGPADGVTHTLRLHGLTRGLPNVMIEIANTLIDDAARQDAMADWLAARLTTALGAG